MRAEREDCDDFIKSKLVPIFGDVTKEHAGRYLFECTALILVNVAMCNYDFHKSMDRIFLYDVH